jgi:hypothetical protein
MSGDKNHHILQRAGGQYILGEKLKIRLQQSVLTVDLTA